MSLRTKLAAALAGVFLVLTLAVVVVQDRIIYPRFVNIENQQAEIDLVRVREAIQREMHHLSMICLDWAWRDATYLFLKDQYDKFSDQNLRDTGLKNARLNIAWFIKPDGSVKAHRAVEFDDEEVKNIELTLFSGTHWNSDHVLLGHKTNNDVIDTILITEHGPLLVSSRWVMPANGEGDPAGTIVFGRFLNDTVAKQLRAQTRVDFKVWPVSSRDCPNNDRLAIAGLAPNQSLLNKQSYAILQAYSIMADNRGEPILAIKALIPRTITMDGTASVGVATTCMIVSWVVIIGLLMLILQRVILRPLITLSREAEQIGQTGDMTRRVTVNGKDEIGLLATSFNSMVANLADMRAKLIDHSRNAGMADVASGVLHNIGNVLNSLNISTNIIDEQLRKSNADGLVKAVELINRHRDNLGAFMTDDHRGKLLPGYLEQLAETIVGEQSFLQKEVQTIKVSVEHVNQIIQAQRIFTSTVNYHELCSLKDVISDSIAIVEAAYKRHGIMIDFKYDAAPTMNTDRAKLMQVFVNLMTNAKDALGHLPKGEKRVSVELRCSGKDTVLISIQDNGMGIAPEHRDKIFTNGFTTKTNGRGYGLHFCAISVKQLGGQIRVHSDGPGKGARFEIEMHLEPKVEVSA